MGFSNIFSAGTWRYLTYVLNFRLNYVSLIAVLGSVVDPKLFLSDPDLTFQEISDPNPRV